MQNFAPAGFSAPQLGQVGSSSVPHEMQNRARSGFSAPQLGQDLPSISGEDRPHGLDLTLRGLRYPAAPPGRRTALTRIRALIVFALALTSALLLAACGGGGAGEDPQQVIHETFSNPTSIRSGTLDLDVKIETSGGQSPGTLEVKLGGKFQSQGSGQFPKFDFDVSLRAESGSQNFSGSGGLTSTGDGAFVNVQGTEYSVPRQVYDAEAQHRSVQVDHRSQERGHRGRRGDQDHSHLG
jgi:hypothetical protein